MRKLTINGKRLKSREALHEYIAKKLNFPEYYGNNLDALYDCLCEINTPLNIIIKNGDILENELGQYAVNLTLMLADICNSNPNIKVTGITNEE